MDTPKRWAVSHIDWSENDLTTVIVSAVSWRDALSQHPKIGAEFAATCGDDLSSAKGEAFNQDMMVNAVEID